jgi:hypothetical protein
MPGSACSKALKILSRVSRRMPMPVSAISMWRAGSGWPSAGGPAPLSPALHVLMAILPPSGVNLMAFLTVF